MEQDLLYRDVRYVIGPEQDGARAWTIHHNGNVECGISGVTGSRGSFKSAVMAARKVIDELLGSSTAA